MKSTPEQDQALRARLAEAVGQFADGSSDRFARMIGHVNGGHVRQILLGRKQLRSTIIHRVHAVEGMETWFLAALSSGSLMDIEHAPSERALEVARLFDALPTDEARLRIHRAVELENWQARS